MCLDFVCLASGEMLMTVNCFIVYLHIRQSRKSVSGTWRRAVSHAAGHCDLDGTSLQLTDCDRMTFESSITKW